MIRKIVASFALAGLVALALDTASCGPTCKPGEASCGTDGTSDAGTVTSTCPQLDAIHACLDVYCKTASNPFCTCWSKGYDLDLTNCPACISINASAFCAQSTDLDAASYDCSAGSDMVSSECVGVQ